MLDAVHGRLLTGVSVMFGCVWLAVPGFAESNDPIGDFLKRPPAKSINKQDKLVLVADARNLGSNGKATQKIRTQSWIIDSTVRHSTRRVKFPNIFFTHSIPLISDGKSLGFLKVQMDQIPRFGYDLMGRFYLIGLQLSSKIKQLMLNDEIGDLCSSFNHMSMALEQADQERRKHLDVLNNEITERKKVESDLLLHRTFFEQSTDAMFIADDKTRFTYFNPAFSEITGYASEDVIGNEAGLLHSEKHDAKFYGSTRKRVGKF